MKNEPKLGSLAPPGAQRDAIHVAIFPAEVVDGYAWPGRKVVIGSDGRVRGTARDEEEWHGIIDPFLPDDDRQAGASVWVLLRPGSITSLRHDWTHPAFSTQPSSTAEDVLREFVRANIGSEYDRLLKMADEYQADGDEMFFIDDTERDNFNAYGEEFWRLWSILRGKKLRDGTETFFSCAC